MKTHVRDFYLCYMLTENACTRLFYVIKGLVDLKRFYTILFNNYPKYKTHTRDIFMKRLVMSTKNTYTRLGYGRHDFYQPEENLRDHTLSIAIIYTGLCEHKFTGLPHLISINLVHLSISLQALSHLIINNTTH